MVGSGCDWSRGFWGRGGAAIEERFISGYRNGERGAVGFCAGCLLGVIIYDVKNYLKILRLFITFLFAQ